jgi:hypothetical protein
MKPNKKKVANLLPLLNVNPVEAGTKSPDINTLNLAGITKNNLLPQVSPFHQGFRLFCGYSIISLSLYAVYTLVCKSLSTIDSIKFTSPTPFTYDYVRLSVRGLVTLAGVFFCYRVIQVGERMVIPLTLLRDPENLKLLIGTGKSNSEPMEHIKDVVKLIKSVKD